MHQEKDYLSEEMEPSGPNLLVKVYTADKNLAVV
jgi:hypothetical protein